MPLDAADIKLLDELLDRKTAALAERIIAALRAAPIEAPMPRLTVEQFAIAAELHPDTIRKKIRVGDIPRNLVYGDCPKKISPKALDLFGVTPPEALARLAAHNLRPTLLQSAA